MKKNILMKKIGSSTYNINPIKLPINKNGKIKEINYQSIIGLLRRGCLIFRERMNLEMRATNSRGTTIAAESLRLMCKTNITIGISREPQVKPTTDPKIIIIITINKNNMSFIFVFSKKLFHIHLL